MKATNIDRINLKEIAHCFGNTFETIRDKYILLAEIIITISQLNGLN